MNVKFHHVALTVKDVERSSKWYGDIFGFKIINRYNNNDLQLIMLKLGDVRIELISFGKNTEKLPMFKSDLMQDLHTVGTKHLCIKVENIDETIRNLKAKEVHFVTEIDTAAFGGRYIFFKDCDNILIELYQEDN